MKVLVIIFTLLGVKEISAQVTRLKTEKQNIELKKIGGKKNGRKNHENVLYQRLLKSNEEVRALLERKTNAPVIWEGTNKIQTGKVFRGTLLNSIISSNSASPVLILADSNQGLPYPTKFSCSGITQNDRVFTLCNKMIGLEKEESIAAQVLNVDGTSGLIGHVEDGKENLIAGAVISDFAQGVLSAGQSRIATPLGAVQDVSLKNQVLGGLIESGRSSSEILTEEMKQAQTIVTIHAGERVLIYFMEAIDVN